MKTMVNELTNLTTRLNNGNELFPMSFEGSKAIYSQIDKISEDIDKLLREKANLISKANETLENEYIETEKYRLTHEFLSAYYTDERIQRMKNIGEDVQNLGYTNSKAIQDHEGRWFATITDACEYHGVSYQTFMTRKNRGWNLKDCFSKKRLYHSSKRNGGR